MLYPRQQLCWAASVLGRSSASHPRPSGRRRTEERSRQALEETTGLRVVPASPQVLISGPDESEGADIESPSQFPKVILARCSFSQRESEMHGVLAKHADAQASSDLRSQKLQNWGQAGLVPQLVLMQMSGQRGAPAGERPRRPRPTIPAAPTSLARNGFPELECAWHPGLFVRMQIWWV